jgi:hypothetical protein
MIKAPKWCSNAVPTKRGWENPTTGELYVAKRFTQEQIDSFNGGVVVEQMYAYHEPVVEETPVEVPQMLHEAPVGNKSLGKMTKAELLALAEQSGVEVSPRDTKAVILEKLEG